MRVPAIRYLVLGALLCATLCLTLGSVGCSSSDSPVNVPNDPPQQDDDSAFTPGKETRDVYSPWDGDSGDQ